MKHLKAQQQLNEVLNNTETHHVLYTVLGTVLYQICAKGRYASFDGETKYYSKNVYINKPTQDEIDSFVDRCCNSKYPNSLYDLDRNTVETFIVELNLTR